MLVRLEIKDFAVISHAVFMPENGFNAITGETGAGKSLLIDAIGLILGQKASKNLIRTDKDEAFVEAVFDVSDVKDSSVFDLLNDSGIDVEDNQLIVSRKITRDGKSIARINGRTVVLAVLKAVSSYLVDIHGQHDTQMIFNDACHTSMLDSFGGEEVSVALKNYREILKEMKELVLEIRRLSVSPEDLNKRKEYLKFAVKELSDANLKAGEEDELHELNKKYKAMEKDSSIISEADEYINGEDGSGLNVASRINEAYKLVNKLSSQSEDDKWNKLAESLLELSGVCEDVSKAVSDMAYENSFDKEKKDSVVARLGLLLDLKAKYSCATLDELMDMSYKFEDELSSLENNAQTVAELKKKRSSVEAKLLSAANELRDIRKKYGDELSLAITNELKDLQMKDARFEVKFEQRSKDKFFSDNGIDNISFVFSANPGEELRSLSKTASGGEASRIMLAIKAILSEADTIPTLIFDEIDTGVSGLASLSIARKLKKISFAHQVLCVTHTAQLAAAADSNHFISKIVEDNKTMTSISNLSSDEKISEVSRLLSGTDATLSVDLAKELISSFRT